MPKILVVDDTLENRNVLRGLLEAYATVYLAKNGEQAIKLANKRVPDLILLDIMMPGMDGYEVCKKLKADDATRDIPIIFLTAKDKMEDEAKGFSLGAVDYITKPILPPILTARVKTQLNLKEARDALTKEVAIQKALRKDLSDALKLVGDSINYAAHIQSALIPDNELLSCFFKDYFVIWHPRDTVGGDIYLFTPLQDEGKCLLFVVDCTGHGVPGALVTMLVKAIERQIVAEIMNRSQCEIDPGWMLNYFDESINKLLSQDNDANIANVGFDGGILYYNRKEQYIRFAGAATPLFYETGGKVQFIKGDRKSIGYKSSDSKHRFKSHHLDVKQGMKLYLSTDGYLDQVGGQNGFSFGKKRFQKLISDNFAESLADQKERFLYNLSDYQGEYKRRDDVTVIGLEI